MTATLGLQHSLRATLTATPCVHAGDIGAILTQLLLILASFVVPLARGFLALATLGVLRLCLRDGLRPSSMLGFVLGFPLRGPCGEFLIPLGKVAGTKVILDWSPYKPPRRRRKHRTLSLWHQVLGSIGALLGTPLGFVSPAVHIPCARWILMPVPTHGMAREGWPDDWPFGRPEVPIVVPTITEGVCDTWSPCHDPERSVRASDNICIRSLPWSDEQCAKESDALLGCYVYTPHYCPVAVTVRMPPSSDLRYAMDVLTDCAPGVPGGLFNAMVPIHPQRQPGYLSVIRFPAHIRGAHEGYAAVICDLTRVGGSYFATILPKNLSHQALVDFLAPLALHDDEPLRFIIGLRTKAWPVEALVTLRDGDAISAIRSLDTTVSRHRAESLHDRNTWGPMQQFFDLDFRQATCVLLHREQRFCIDTASFQGIDLFDHLVSVLRLDASRTAVCSFPIEDLEVQGERCASIVAVADVAAPTGGSREPARQDFFILCDLRPLGLKPRFVYAHLPCLHLPSLVADLGIALPAAFEVGVAGARMSGDTLRVSCNCTLLFYAKEAVPDDSVSMTDLSPVREIPASPSLPSESAEGLLSGPHTGSAPVHLFDPSIPEGHGWNLGVEAGFHDEVVHPMTDPLASHSPPPDDVRPGSWNYADYCAHMAGAWDESCPAADSHAPDLNLVTDGPTYQAAPSADNLPLTEAVSVSHAENRTDHSVAGPSVHSDAVPQLTEVIALVYSPDCTPEFTRARVEIPCGVDHIITHISAGRYGPRAKHFPRLTPAVPQPYKEYLLFVSSPEWLDARPTVILDCQHILHTVFACLLFPTCTRESLLAAAGLRHDSDISVFVHGLLQPLEHGQRISLVAGMVISFAPGGSGAPVAYDIATLLQTRDGWDSKAILPGPGYFPGQSFWVLTDSQPTRFTLGYERRPCLHSELCEHLNSAEHRLNVIFAQPDISDAFPKGHWTTHVIVATECISNIPCPPAKGVDTKVALILDCRPLLLGIRWLIHSHSFIPVAQIVQMFEEHCPDGFVVTITGCDAVQRENDMVFPIQNGQVLVISFDEDLPSSDHGGTPPDGPFDEFPDRPKRPDTDEADSRCTPEPGGSAPSGKQRPAREARNRSRSPRGSGSAISEAPVTQRTQMNMALERYQALNLEEAEVKWEFAFDHDAYADSTPSLTPVLTLDTTRFRLVIPAALSGTFEALYRHGSQMPLLPGFQLLANCGDGWNPVDKLLSGEPSTGHRADGAYEAARSATVSLGFPWPGDTLRPALPALPDVESEGVEADEDPTFIEVTFLVLAPEYCPDAVTMQIAVPQSVAETIELLDLCRSSQGRDLFPVLHPVFPQPDVRWGLAIAAPSWLGNRVIICLDLTLIDGRVFAAVAPPELDKHILLNMAGLSGAARVDVYLADQTEPVEYGAELFVANGHCISFVPGQEPLEFRCPLQAMLNTHLGWADGPAFPQPDPGDRFCAVAEGFYCDFLLLPERTDFYRADLAARFQIPLHSLCIQPAAPRQTDVTVYGRHCRTVLCVSSSPRRDDDEVGLLDCRPILEGWSKVRTSNRWLDVGALRRSLTLAAPMGHRVELSGCGRYWNWLWLEPGQVVVVSYVPAETQDTEHLTASNPGISDASDDPDADPPGDAQTTSRQESRRHATTTAPTRDSPADVDVSSVTSCATHLASAIVGCTAIMWTNWFFEHACPPSTFWSTSAPVAVFASVLGLLGVAARLRTRGTDRPLLIWLCLFTFAHYGTPVVAAVRHEPMSCIRPPWQGQEPGCLENSRRLRPLPTPCRNSPRLPVLASTWKDQDPWCCTLSADGDDSVDDDLDLGHLSTLLEDCIQDTSCPAMFLAHTLVETLVDHFACSRLPGGDVRCSESQPRKRLALVQLLPELDTYSDPSFPRPLPFKGFSFPVQGSPVSENETLHIASLSLGFSLCDLRRFLGTKPSLHAVHMLLRHCLSPAQWTTSRFSSGIEALKGACKPGELICFTDGSFTPGGSVKTPKCGWACIFIDPHSPGISAAFGACPSDTCPLDEPSAYLGECAGLLAASLISTVAFQWRTVHFYSDCTSALAVAFGRASFSLSGLAQTCRTAFCFRRAVGHVHDTHHCVPGHSDCFGNDLADALSKSGAQLEVPGCGLNLDPPQRIFWLSDGGQRLAWAASVIRRLAGDDSLPPLNTLDLGHDRWHGGLSSVQLLAPFLPLDCLDERQESRCPENEPARLQLTLASFNTLSLHSTGEQDTVPPEQPTGLAFCPGRAQMLADQLLAHNVHAICLQETRCEQGFLRTRGFLRFCSGATKGQWGTEWWFREEHSFVVAATSGRPISSFRKPLFTTLHADPRRLFLRMICGHLRWVFIGLHAPHRATERGFLEAWWHDTHNLIRAHARNDPVILAGDMNASLGSIQSALVGSHGAETEDVPGQALHAILREFEILLPATWEHLHSGPHHTYFQKRGHKLCRPDFVGVPVFWVTPSCQSVLAPAINAGHSCPDHVAATFSTSAPCTSTPPRPCASRRFKPCELTDSRIQQVEAALQAFPAPSWHVSAHAHAASLVSLVQQVLADTEPKKQSQPYRTYLKDDTWNLQQRVAAVRRSLHRLQHRTRSQYVAACFHCWRNGSPGASPDFPTWAKQADLSVAAHLAVLRTLGPQLKKACRRDRNDHVAQLADKLASCPSPDIFQCLHTLLGHRRRKKYQVEPLPAVTNLDGTMCPDGDATMRRWREHFGGMEGGVETSIPLLVDKWTERIRHSTADRPWPIPPALSDVPTETDLQRLLVCAKAGKSPGMDGIPVEVGKRLADALAPHLHRVALKTAFRGVEPCGFKAGQAIWFYKGKGPHTSCSSFRAILLLPVWSKIIHQALRPPMKRHFEQNAPTFQIGGRSRCTAVFGCHLVRSACRVATAAGHSHFTLFADIASAYYCVIQQLVAHWSGRGEHSSILDGVRQPLDEVLPEAVVSHLQQPSALSSGGASTWLEALTDSLQSDNFFLLRGDDTAVMTSKGSRPGSSWADLIFAALIRRILGRRDQLRSKCEGASSPLILPYDGVKCLDPCPDDSAKISISEVVWADDLAIPRLTEPRCAARAIGLETGFLTDAFQEFGFSLSFGPHKTAGLLTLRGPGSRNARRDVFGQQGLRGLIPILLETGSSVTLPLVDSYKHLGCQQGPAGSLKSEIQYRVAQARATFSEGRRKVYKNPHISLKRKGFILGATVIPKLVYGSGAWGPLTAAEMRVFSGALWSFYRPLLGVKLWEDQRIEASTCFALLGLPGPSTLLRSQRLLYLGQMIRAGPAELWAVLRADQPHASLLREDVRWLHAWTWQTTGLPNPDTDWGTWSEHISNNYPKFKGMVKRAKALDVCRHTVVAALSGLHRALLSVCGASDDQAPPPTARLTEVCIPCRRAFADRLSWAGHAARKHGYRSHAFLCAKGTTCLSCGKQFSSPGRLRRHLYTKARCVQTWGSFTPDSLPQPANTPHSQAPPQQVAGTWDPTAAAPVHTDIAWGLFQDLCSCALDDEDGIWQLITSYVEPLDVLRATVQAWAEEDAGEPTRRATADNMLLLLDVELLADHVQPKSVLRAFPQDSLPVWSRPGSAPIVLTGEVAAFSLMPPPAAHLDFSKPTSLRLRDATAYATWLEAGCAKIAHVLEASLSSPVILDCPRLDSALGPARGWLTAAGFQVDARGLASQRD